MTVHHSRFPYIKKYELCNAAIEAAKYAKYLGITLSNNLEWGHRIDIITKKASNTLNFVRRNLKHCHDTAKKSPTSPC